MTDDPIDSEVFDKAGFIHRMMGDKELASEIMLEFLQDMERQIENLKDESTDAEFTVLVRLAHTIKGAAGNVGAKRMQKTALHAEQAAAKGDRTSLVALLPKIEASFIELRHHLLSSNELNLGDALGT